MSCLLYDEYIFIKINSNRFVVKVIIHVEEYVIENLLNEIERINIHMFKEIKS